EQRLSQSSRRVRIAAETRNGGGAYPGLVNGQCKDRRHRHVGRQKESPDASADATEALPNVARDEVVATIRRRAAVAAILDLRRGQTPQPSNHESLPLEQLEQRR